MLVDRPAGVVDRDDAVARLIVIEPARRDQLVTDRNALQMSGGVEKGAFEQDPLAVFAAHEKLRSQIEVGIRMVAGRSMQQFECFIAAALCVQHGGKIRSGASVRPPVHHRLPDTRA